MKRARALLRLVVGIATLVRGVVRLLARNTRANVEGAFDIADATSRLRWDKLSLELLRNDPDAAALMRDRYGVGLRYDRERLAAAPANSLGRVLHENLERGFDPDFYRRTPIDSDWHWASHRGRQIHDVLHIVTGYPTTSVGEIGVFAFLAANMLDYGCLAIAITAATGHLLLRPRRLATDLVVFSNAFLHGRQLRPLLGVKFEELLETNVADVRERLGLPRCGLAAITVAPGADRHCVRDLESAPIEIVGVAPEVAEAAA